MQAGLIFNIQRYSVQDGPGIRTTVFFKGCPLSCAWCHNPEGLSSRPQLAVMESRCLRCGACHDACKHASASGASDGPCPTTDVRCDLCGECVEACPTEARQALGKRMSVEELMVELLRDRLFYDDSGGGVTFSGGEPLLQAEFLEAMLQRCHEEELHTAVDTSGFTSIAKLEAIVPWTDLFLFDLKHLDEELHLRLTGVSNKPVLENLRWLGEVHSNIWLRIPLIPGCTDDPSFLDAAAEFAAGLKGIRQVNLIPYHPTGVPKYQRLQLPSRFQSAVPLSVEMMASATDRFRARGLVVHASG